MEDKFGEYKIASERFAVKMKKLAGTGRLNVLSITIGAWGNEIQFQLAHAFGIKDLSITAQFVA